VPAGPRGLPGRSRARYALTVKGHQRARRDALARQPWGQVPGLVQHEVGPGRRKTRSIQVITTDGQPQLQRLFPHAAQIAKIVRRRRRPGRNPTVQTVYLITSLTTSRPRPSSWPASSAVSRRSCPVSTPRRLLKNAVRLGRERRDDRGRAGHFPP
jgi:hypothetical protein